MGGEVVSCVMQRGRGTSESFQEYIFNENSIFSNNSFKIFKFRENATLKMSVLHFKSSNICYFIAITERKATATKEAIALT